MNAKILELAKQAGFIMWNDESCNPGDVIDWSSRYDEEFVKFAELIVNECAGVVEKNLFESIGWNTSKKVKQHFGVEE